VQALAALPDGRVVSAENGGPVLVWDPDEPGAGPAELGRHDLAGPPVLVLPAVAVLPDGRVVSGGWPDRVLVWDPDEPAAGPAELGRHGGVVTAVAVLPDGRVVSADGDRVWLWDAPSGSPSGLLACSVYALATSLSPSGVHLFIGHARGGISCWEIRAVAQNTPGTRQHTE
jgi:hypothetical protein